MEWDKIQPQYLGYASGAEALLNGQVDALWLLTFPNSAVNTVAKKKEIKLIPLYDEALKNGKLFEVHPYYS